MLGYGSNYDDDEGTNQDEDSSDGSSSAGGVAYSHGSTSGSKLMDK